MATGAGGSVTLRPIGVVRCSRKDVRDDGWDAEESWVELDSERFTEEALMGLEDFSHAEVLYFFDRVDPAKVETGARHPRNNEAWPRVGIFAQRWACARGPGPAQPGRLGCRAFGTRHFSLVFTPRAAPSSPASCRGKNRPNQIGLSVCRVLRVAASPPRLFLSGLDAVDGTPVLDIKPWVQEFGPRGDVRQPPWITELMRGYWGE